MTVRERCWLARGAFGLVLAAVALVLAVAGWRSLAMAGLTVIGVCAVLAGGFWFLANRGVVRWLAPCPVACGENASGRSDRPAAERNGTRSGSRPGVSSSVSRQQAVEGAGIGSGAWM